MWQKFQIQRRKKLLQSDIFEINGGKNFSLKLINYYEVPNMTNLFYKLMWIQVFICEIYLQIPKFSDLIIMSLMYTHKFVMLGT